MQRKIPVCFAVFVLLVFVSCAPSPSIFTFHIPSSFWGSYTTPGEDIEISENQIRVNGMDFESYVMAHLSSYYGIDYSLSDFTEMSIDENHYSFSFVLRGRVYHNQSFSTLVSLQAVIEGNTLTIIVNDPFEGENVTTVYEKIS